MHTLTISVLCCYAPLTASIHTHPNKYNECNLLATPKCQIHTTRHEAKSSEHSLHMKPSHTFLAYARAEFCSTGTLKPPSTVEWMNIVETCWEPVSIVHGCSYFSGVTGQTVCPRYREVLYSLESLVEQCIQTMWWVVHNSKAAIFPWELHAFVCSA